MEANLSEVFRDLVAVAFVVGFLWILLSTYRYYRTEKIPSRVKRMMRRYHTG